jgi:putative DNA primase/helicase
MDTLQNFFDECCIIDTDKTAATNLLYDTYVKWCVATGEREITSTKFGTKMKEKGFEQGRTSVLRYWKGIGVIDNREEDEIPGMQKVVGGVFPFKK